MPFRLLVVLVAGCAAQASTPDTDCVGESGEAATVEIKFPKRIIEVETDGGTLSGGLLNVYSPCAVEVTQDPYVLDFADCCPPGWSVLAMSPDGLLCEEN